MKRIIYIIFYLSALNIQAQTDRSLSNIVCEHYSHPKDSLKLKSALFLLSNMKYHGTVKSEAQDAYYKRLAEIETTMKYPKCKEKILALVDSMKHVQNAYSTIADMCDLTPDYLISNIDDAYDKWQNGCFAQHLSFGEYCEYILPYRIANENIGTWRNELYERYKKGIESICKIEDKRNSAYWAATQINNLIRKERMNIQAIPHFGGVDFPIDVLKNLKMGECRDYAFKTAYAMRACGIPICVDFTPQWPSRPHGHHWNVVLDNTGKNVPFMGAESNPGYPCKDDYPKAKVYRYTYGYQQESLFHLNKDCKEDIPSTFNTPFIKDVTDEYTRCVDIVINIEGKTVCKRFAYLAVFNNQKWVPIAYARIEGGKAIFKNVGRNAVYMPTIWKGQCIPISAPILIKSNGEKLILKPDHTSTGAITIRRKYPVFSAVHNYSKRMVNAKFEMSNDPNFANVLEVGRITRNPEMNYDSIITNTNGKAYRYLRYVSPAKSFCNVAEIIFFNKGIRIYPMGYASNSKPIDGINSSMAFDDNLLTFFQTEKADNGMLAVDFGTPMVIDKIKYMPRNDDNYITKGHEYRLDYWGEEGAICHSKTLAKSDSLHFESLPANALFFLHDLTRGKEERPFIIQGKNIIWY